MRTEGRLDVALLVYKSLLNPIHQAVFPIVFVSKAHCHRHSGLRSILV